MKLITSKREDKRIRMVTEVDLGGAKGTHNVRRQTDDYEEAPLPDFSAALDALAGVAVEVMEIPTGWADGLSVDGFSLRETKAGTRSAKIHFTKKLDRDEHEWSASTPWFRIDKAQDGEAGSLGCSAKNAARVATAIYEAERYIGGERSQMLLIEEQDPNTAGGKDQLGLED